MILTTGAGNPIIFTLNTAKTLGCESYSPTSSATLPVVQIHPETAGKLGIKDGDWVWIETPRGRIKQKAKLFAGMNPRIVVAQASWYYPEKPGPDHGVWESNTNVLTSNKPPFDPPHRVAIFQSATVKSLSGTPLSVRQIWLKLRFSSTLKGASDAMHAL